MKNTRIAIIGSGFSGLASAALLAQKGYEVHIYEKNDQAGGRARVWKKDGFMCFCTSVFNCFRHWVGLLPKDVLPQIPAIVL